jgi:hypothetical protein
MSKAWGRGRMLKRFLRMYKGKRPVGNPRLKWGLNIEMNFGGMGWSVIYRIHMKQDKD